MRAMIAEKPVPTAMAGSIRCFSHNQKLSSIATYPIAGIHSRFAANAMISRIASQKSGI